MMRARPGLAISIILVAVAVVVGVALLVVRPWESRGEQLEAAPSTPAAETPLVDATTHKLNDAGPEAPVIIEFLDFECSACASVQPTMNALREQYGDQVTFAVRYFPLPGHVNSVQAALAAEAAAQQGKFEPMLQYLFAGQPEWGDKPDPNPAWFRAAAEQLGLDMAAYDAAVADTATFQRVELDFQAGNALGVRSTPTIFVDGERVELQQLSDIEDAIVGALAD